MKKILLLFAAMLVAMAATAQTPTATLSHEGTVKCFYGKEALVNAVAEAENGDNITLSSGLFSGTTIDKAVTVKGAGMSPDTINNITPTTISSDMTINTSDVTVEGVYIAAKLTLNHFNNIKIIKSTITGWMYCNAGSEDEVRVNQYLIDSKIIGRTEIYNNNDLDFYVENSYMGSVRNYYYSYNYNYQNICLCHIVAQNSIIGLVLEDYPSSGYTHHYSIYNSTFSNCFLFKASGRENYIDHSNQVYYCVGLGDEIFSQALGGSTSNTNITVENFGDFFKTFDGTYNDNETFELTSSAQTTFLGDDGTQIGIYGGSMPFDPKPNNPYITKLTVAEKSTPQGTLSVDIQVLPAQ